MRGLRVVRHGCTRYMTAYGATHAQVEIDGVDLRDVDAAWFRARIGVVSQDPRLFSMTIRENIAYGLQQVLS